MRAADFHLSTTEIEIIEKMFHVLFNDLGNGISEEKAGWKSPNELGISPITGNGLLKSGVVEKNSRDEVRLNFRAYGIRQRLKGLFELQVKQLEYLLNIQQDRVKVEKAQGVLKQIFEVIQQYPESWTYITALGWWRMMESSGMPALIDEVLKEGFSPEDWTIKAIRSSPGLALGIAQRLGGISEFRDAISFLEKLGITTMNNIVLLEVPDHHDIEKIKNVLRWTEIEKELSGSVIKTLVFPWFSLLVLEHANLLPLSTEYSIELHKRIWGVLEKLLGRKQQDLMSNLENTIRKLTEKQITCAPEILRIPEAI